MKFHFCRSSKRSLLQQQHFGIQQQHCKHCTAKNLDITPPWPFLFIKVMNSIIACALFHSAYKFRVCRRLNMIVLHYYPTRHEIIGWTNIALVYEPRNNFKVINLDTCKFKQKDKNLKNLLRFHKSCTPYDQWHKLNR